MSRFIILLLLLLTACATPAQAQAPSGTPGKALAAILPTPAPTVDVASPVQTAQAGQRAAVEQMNQAILQSNLSLATANAAMATSNSANSTAIAAQVEAKKADNERAVLNITQQAQAQAAAHITETAQSRSITATVYAPTQVVRMAQAKSEAATMPFRLVVESLTTPLIILCGTLLLFYVLRKWAQPRPVVEQVTPNLCEEEEAQPTAPVRLYERVPDSTTINRDTEPPGDPEKFRALIRHSEKGNFLGINNVVLAHCYGSNMEYSEVLTWLEDHKYVEAVGGAKMFSRAGVEFCRHWETIHPCPPAEDAQKDHPFSHDNDNHTVGEYPYQFKTLQPRRKIK